MKSMTEVPDQDKGQLIFMTGAETDGIQVYCRVVEGQEFFRFEYIANAGFETDKEIEDRNLIVPRFLWSLSLDGLLLNIQMPWFLFSFMKVDPKFADQIISIKKRLSIEMGHESFDSRGKEHFYFSERDR